MTGVLSHTVSRAIVAGAVLLSAGCSASVSPQTYSVGRVGMQHAPVNATVVAVRPAPEGTTGSTAVAGGVIGASAGVLAGAGRGAPAAIAVILIGATIGAVAGAVADGSITRGDLWEFMLRTENGAELVVVSRTPVPLVTGTPVTVAYGSPHRMFVRPPGDEGKG